MTYQLIYSSEATTPMQSDDLQELLEQARRSNGARGVTGALIYAEQMFLQILEGDRASVEALVERIRRDVRHENVKVLQVREVAAPMFAGWNMAYVGATREQVALWAGLDVSIDAAGAAGEDRSGRDRTSQFASEILALLRRDDPPVTGR